MDFIVSVLSFIVALGLLIAIHEFGHFWVARKVGVKVHRFSIGFGRPIYKRTFTEDNIEFVVAAIPLGGYVKMLDEREEDVPAEELHRAFNRKSLGERFAVVFAGPALNFIFAFILYWLLFVIGISGLKPIVDAVEPNSPFALAGLQAGDEILSVDGRHTPTLEAVRMGLIETVIDQKVVDVNVKQDALERTLKLDLTETPVDSISKNLLQYLGITPYRPKLIPVVGDVVEGGAGEKAGLLNKDRILRADDTEFDDWVKWAEYVRARPNQLMRLTVLRDGIEISLDLTPAVIETQNGNIGRVGLMPFVPEDFYQDMMAKQHYGPLESISASVVKTWDMSVLTLQMLWKMLTGQASLENISGPISIAHYAGQSAQIGILPFLSFMAIISVSLGVLNLLPIPLLDGGHLMYYVIEFFRGNPVSENGQLLGQKIGIVFLGCLMFVAIFNDISRIFS